MAEILALLPDAAFIHDSGTVICCNDVMNKLFAAIENDELIGLNVETMVHPEDIDVLRRRVKETEKYGTAQTSATYRFLRVDKLPFHANIRARLIEVGGRNMHLAIIRDVSHQIAVEENLQRSEEQFRESFEKAHIGMATVEPDWRISRVNQALCKMLGYTDEELVGKSIRDITHPDDIEFNKTEWDDLIAGDINSFHIEKRYICKNGSTIWVSMNCAMVRDQNGDPLHSVSQIENITEQKQNRTDLSVAKEEAEKASNIKSEFLANMSHELRTPLNAIIGFADILANDVAGPLANEKQTEYVTNILQSGNHLLGLINEILDLSVIESGKMELHESDFHLSKCINSAFHLVQTNADLEAVHLINCINGSTTKIHADETRFRQILVNLLTNAIKFSKIGSSVSVEGKETPDNGYAITVKDQGIGMSKEDLEIALTKFGQVGRVGMIEHEGTGLGLPLTKGLVEVHGGTLLIESEVDVGTTITILLPAERVTAG